MKFEDLRAFLKIIETGSITAAAKELNVAQPALSMRTARLEDTLHKKLLIRTPRGVTPTEAGRKLAQHARGILQAVEFARHDVSSGQGKIAGEVQVCLPTSAMAMLTPLLLGEAGRLYPDVQVLIQEEVSSVAGELIESGRVDLALLPNAAELRGIEVDPVIRENFYFIGSVEHDPLPPKSIKFADLTQYQLVMATRSNNARRCLEQVSLQEHRYMNIRYHQNAPLATLAIIKAGLAHGVMSIVQTRDSVEKGDVYAIPIVDPSIERTFAIVYPKSRALTSPVREIKALLRKIVVELNADGQWPGTLID